MHKQSKAYYKDFIAHLDCEEVEFADKTEFGILMMGQSPKSDTYNINQDGMPLLNGAADYTGHRLTPNKYTTNPIRVCSYGDLIFCIRATIGLLVFADKEYCLGRGVAAITKIDELYKEFVYHALEDSIELLKANANGSVIIGISKNDVNRLKMKNPSITDIERFHSVQCPLFELIKKNNEENYRLSKLRDRLLQKLMSGKIDVSDLDI